MVIEKTNLIRTIHGHSSIMDVDGCNFFMKIGAITKFSKWCYSVVKPFEVETIIHQLLQFTEEAGQ